MISMTFYCFLPCLLNLLPLSALVAYKPTCADTAMFLQRWLSKSGPEPPLFHFQPSLAIYYHNTMERLKKNKKRKGNLEEDSESICLLALDRSKIDPTRPGLSDAMLCDAP